MMAAGAAASVAIADGPPPVEQVCEDAHWEVASEDLRPGGSMVAGRARIDRRCHADGRMSVQEYRYLGPDGTAVFHGVTFAFWDAERAHGDLLWLTVGDPGHSFLDAEWEDGVLLQRGLGVDAPGAYLEHSIADFNGVGDSVYSLYRSYDNGDTWLTPVSRAKWYRSSDEPAAYPDHLAVALAGVELDDGMTPLLDGYAAFQLLFDEAGAPNGVVFARTVVLDQPTWRTSTWRIGDRELSNTDAPLPSE